MLAPKTKIVCFDDMCQSNIHRQQYMCMPLSGTTVCVSECVDEVNECGCISPTKLN